MSDIFHIDRLLFIDVLLFMGIKKKFIMNVCPVSIGDADESQAVIILPILKCTKRVDAA